MALSAKQIGILKCVNKSTKSIINGYVHEIQQTFNLKQEIPSEIVQIIILFYYLAEHFDLHNDTMIEVLGDNADIIQKHKTADDGFNNFVFGAVSIPSTCDDIIVWTFKVLDNYTPSNNGLSLGIINCADANIKSTQCGYDNTSIRTYLYCSSSSIYHKGGLITRYGEELGNVGTVIKMKLDMKQGQLTFYKNDKCLGIACQIDKGQDIEYKMAVTLFWSGAKFKLLNFECLCDDVE